MKISDDCRAKIRLWALNPTVAPAPRPPVLPKFSGKKFSSHAEMNAWKKELLAQLAKQIADHGRTPAKAE